MQYLVALLMVFFAVSAQARSPNVVVIVADDLGYNDVGFNGGTLIKTPKIDALAAEGTIFTNGYASAAVCSPSRAGIMTGRYQQRFGHENNPPPWLHNTGLPLDQVTMADVMRSAGYATAAIGKWHLGGAPNFRPNKRGFDYAYGFYPNSSIYLPPIPLQRNGAPVVETRYLTTAFGDEAAAFIHRNKNRPFFLYLAFNAPHEPLQATRDYLKQYSAITDPKRRTYAAVVSAMDDAIGVVAAALDDEGLTNDTLLVFLSDNGGPLAHGANNAPLRGGKPMIYEGGIRVPFFVRWPGVVPAHFKYRFPVIALDIFPTAAAATGAPATGAPLPPSPLDGVNLLPYLRGPFTTAPHAALFWRMDSDSPADARSAVRAGQMKLTSSPSGTALYNVDTDIGETRNVKTQLPAVLTQLQARYAAWDKLNVAPLWPSK